MAKPTASCCTNGLPLGDLAGRHADALGADERAVQADERSRGAAMMATGTIQNTPSADEDEHRAEHEHLVGQRIEERPERGGAVPAGQVAVDAVADAQHEPQDERRPRAARLRRG